MQRNLIRLPVPESNFSVSKLTMAGSNDTTVGDLNEQANDTQTAPALESDLRECLKRYDERLHDQNEWDLRLMSELSSIKRTLQTQPHLTEEGKKARIAPGKLRSCVLMCLSHIVDDADRRISQYLRCSACFSEHPACSVFEMAVCALRYTSHRAHWRSYVPFYIASVHCCKASLPFELEIALWLCADDRDPLSQVKAGPPIRGV